LDKTKGTLTVIEGFLNKAIAFINRSKLSSLINLVGNLVHLETFFLACFAHPTKILGVINPVTEITAAAHQYGAKVLIDSCQSVPRFSSPPGSGRNCHI
jgi:hypothetical protein